MEFNTFRKMVCEKLQERLGEEYELGERDVKKINNTIHKGITVERKPDNICPVIYLEKSYERVEAGEISIEEELDSLQAIVENSLLEKAESTDIQRVCDWNKVKEFVKIRLVNTEKNQALLVCTPHIEYWNLSATFYLDIKVKGEDACVFISRPLMDMYGVTEEALLKQAMLNMEQNAVFKDMVDVIGGIMEVEDENFEKQLYVLSNKTNTYGASVILLPEVRAMLTNFFEGDVYMLPSSVHEWIILPARGCNPDELCAMVKEVNATTLHASEYLADNVYLLDTDGNIQIVA